MRFLPAPHWTSMQIRNRVFEGLAFKTVTSSQDLDGERYTFRLGPSA